MRAAPILSMTSQDVARLLLSRRACWACGPDALYTRRKVIVKTLQMHGIKNAPLASSEVERLNMFKDLRLLQEECAGPHPHRRGAEPRDREGSALQRAGAINIPRDYWTQVVELPLPTGVKLERTGSFSEAKFPVIFNGAGVILSGGPSSPWKQRILTLGRAWFCCNYQHNDAFPGDPPDAIWGLWLQRIQGGQEVKSKAGRGSGAGQRLNPLYTLRGGVRHGLLRKDAKLIQVDINGDRIGLTKVRWYRLVGCEAAAAKQLAPGSWEGGGRAERAGLVKEKKAAWGDSENLESLDPTSWTTRAWRAIMRVMPKEAIMSSDIGNNCAIGNAYPTFASPRKYLAPGLFGPCGYGFPAIWAPRYDDNFVGTELNKGVEYAEMAKACGLKGVKVQSVEQLERALSSAIEGQMKRGETTLVEVLLNQELGEPFRRDAMKAPVQVAPINASDMAEKVREDSPDDGIKNALGIIGSAMMPISEEVRDHTRIFEINIPPETYWDAGGGAASATGRKAGAHGGAGKESDPPRRGAPLRGQVPGDPPTVAGYDPSSGSGVRAVREVAERLCAPRFCCNTSATDAFPGDHPHCYMGAFGYNGSRRPWTVMSKADVVKALGTRLTLLHLPVLRHGLWPKDATLIQVDINGGPQSALTSSVDVGIQGDAGLVAEQLLQQLAPEAGSGRAERAALVKEKKAAWAAELESLDHELDDEGTTWNQRARQAAPDFMSPRQAWRAIMRVMPKEAIMSSDIGNNCAIGNAYPSFASPRKYLAPGLFGPCGYGFPAILGAKVGNPDVPVVGFAGDGAFGISVNEITACGRGDWPPVTMVVFRNFQWGAEKRNTTLWYDDNFVGTELNKGVEYAEMAKACGLKGVKVQSVEQLERALSSAIEGQMKRGETTLVEVLLNQELGEPFRRDAMKAPVQVAPINASDMAE
ncbi:unnamed protein product [Effrenium voratum]|uniref:Sulfoacetaldehyde acetyltransferase n=1 Tax=Effrenium voratum TaxID=2562239 RepID=A0AA36HM03_9DINO|nr:unnamed protein product [Effrenium voratum]